MRTLEAGVSNVDSVKALLESRDKVVDSVGVAEGRYRAAGNALTAYATVLDRVQADTLRALHAAQAAAGDGADAAGDQARYHQQAQDAKDAGDAEAQDKWEKKEAAAKADAAHSSSVVAAQKQVVEQAVTDRDAAARTAIEAITSSTSNDGLNDSWWDDWGAKLTEWIAKVAEAIATIAGILALIFCWVPILGEVLMVIAAVAGIVAALANIILAATGEKSWGEAIESVVFAALGCIGVGGAMRTLGSLAKLGLKAGAKAAFKDIAGAFKNLPLKVRGTEPGTRCNGIGEPVDAATGFVYFARLDAQLPGDLPLVLQRRYVSGFAQGRLFGSRWGSTLDQRVVVGDSQLELVRADCSVLNYPLLDEGHDGLPWGSADRWKLSRTAAAEYQAFDPVAGLTYLFSGDGSDKWLTRISDAAGNWIRIDRDAQGMPELVAHHGGYQIKVTSHDGRISSYTMVSGAESQVLTSFDYVNRNLVTEISAVGAAVRYDVDDAGRVIGWTDANNVSYVYRFDAEDRCVSEGLPDPDDNTYRYRYSYADGPTSGGMTTTIIGPGGGEKRFEVDARGLVLAETDEVGNRVEYDYDSSSRKIAVRNALGEQTSYGWDDWSRMTTVTGADGAVTEVVYDDAGLPVQIIDPTGAVTRQQFDAAGRLLQRVDPMGAVRRWQWSGDGRQVLITDAEGRVSEVVRDASGLVSVAGDASGTTRVERDVFGNPVRVVDPAGNARSFSWSAEGRLLGLTNPDGTTESWAWDGQGNLIERVDASGRRTSFGIAPFDVVARQVSSDGAALSFGYDDECRLVSVTNQNGAVWRYVRDAAGRVIGEVDYDGRRTSYELDAAGRTAVVTNAAGERIEFAFDQAGRTTSRRAGGEVAQFSYDAAGRLTAAADAQVVVEREFDAVGRLVAESTNGARMAWQLDAAGNTIGRVTPAGMHSSWQLDGVGRRAGLELAGQSVRFELDALGRAVSTEFAGGRIDSTFDQVGRLTSRASTSSAGEQASWQVAYGYTAAGELAWAQDSARGSRHLQLDAAGRITAVSGDGGAAETYAYDSAGNITQAAWAAAGTEAQGDLRYQGTLLVEAGRDRYDYDGAGRLVRRTRRLLSGGEKVWQYAWNPLNQFTSVIDPIGHRWEYAYDGLNRRVAKTHRDAAGQVVEAWRFAWDGPVLAEQTHQVGGVETSTTWEHDGFTPVAQARSRSQADFDVEFAAIITDLVGAPVRVQNAAGQVEWTSAASTWGATDADVAMPLRFPGQYHDVETGLFYNLNRYYNPDTGRYVSSDPLGLAPSPNPHAYVPNPTTQIDPLGLHGVDVDLKAFPDVSGLRGADPDSVLDVIPDHWIVETPKKVPDGIRFRNPNAPGQSIIYEPGWVGATDPVHAGPYLRVSSGSSPVFRIPLAGNPGL